MKSEKTDPKQGKRPPAPSSPPGIKPAPAPPAKPVDRPVPPSKTGNKPTPASNTPSKKTGSPPVKVGVKPAPSPTKSVVEKRVVPSGPEKRPPVPPANALKKKVETPAPSPPKTGLRKTPFRRRRVERSDTISQIQYQMARKRMSFRSLRFALILLLPIAAVIIGAQWKWSIQIQTNQIVQWVFHGEAALENDRKEEAAEYFQKALDQYISYHMDRPEFWWQRDAQVFTAMFQTAQGWRRLGDYHRGLQTFQHIALHNSRGIDSWVGRQLQEEIETFLDWENWTDEELREIYQGLMEAPPSTWGSCSRALIMASERLSLYFTPMQQRLEAADMIVYGTPSKGANREDYDIEVDAISIYYVDRPAGALTIQIAPEIPAAARERLEWYIQERPRCLFFVKNPERPVLQNLEGIILSEPYSVEEFNRLYRE